MPLNVENNADNEAVPFRFMASHQLHLLFVDVNTTTHHFNNAILRHSDHAHYISLLCAAENCNERAKLGIPKS